MAFLYQRIINLHVFFQTKFRSEIGKKMDFLLISYLLIMVSLSSIAEDGLWLLILKDRLINGSKVCIKTVICILLSWVKQTSWRFWRMPLEMAKLCWWKISKRSSILLYNLFWASNSWKKDSNGYYVWEIRMYLIMLISNSTWQQSYQILTIFPKYVSKLQLLTLLLHLKVFRISCLLKS